MQIKVFKAGTMKEAMAAMKAELGEDAVILHSKKYKEGGLLGIGSREVVEITAAVEESALPERENSPRPAPPRPTLFANAANRYKTSGTAQGVEQAEKDAENLSAPPGRTPTISPRPSLLNSETAPRTLQSDALVEKIAAQAKNSPPPEPEPNFDELLKDAEDNQPAEVESQSDAEILNSTEEFTEEEIAPYNEPVTESEETSPEDEWTDAENELADEEEIFLKDEEVSEEKSVEESEQASPQEEISDESPAEEDSQPEETPSEETETSPEEKLSEEENSPSDETQEKTSEKTPAEEKISEEEKTPTEEKVSPPPPNPELTPEQFAQAQAMMFAQFNQMQMAQVMQQAVAQAQAQAQLQVAEMAEQMREVHRQRMEASGKLPPTAQVEQQEQDKIQRLEDEIAHMKALLAEVLGKDSRKGGISLHEALRRQEVDEDILTEMATNAGAGDTLVDSRSTGAKITLSSYLSEHLRFSDGIKLNRHGVRLVALLGTTGVGKTTTLAKIAAKFVLEHGVNAALITADTYRISAVDQLKTYSDILGLPLEIVYTPAELGAAIERHKHKELILIDTAGRSQQNIQQMRELEEFLRVNPRIEKHLVISATTKLTDAKEIISRFSAVNPEKIIITKIDETGSLGMVINLMRNRKVALSYLTTGQSVPDDIELATADILTDLVLKKVTV